MISRAESRISLVHTFVRIMYIMLNNLHRSITSWFTSATIEISMLRILRYLPFITLGLSYTYFTTC